MSVDILKKAARDAAAIDRGLARTLDGRSALSVRLSEHNRARIAALVATGARVVVSPFEEKAQALRADRASKEALKAGGFHGRNGRTHDGATSGTLIDLHRPVAHDKTSQDASKRAAIERAFSDAMTVRAIRCELDALRESFKRSTGTARKWHRDAIRTIEHRYPNL